MPRKQPKLCEREGCTKGAQSGGTPNCIAHGGGRRCKEEDCPKSAQGCTWFCIASTAVEGDASTRAASRLLNPVARRIAGRMAGAGAARRRTAPRELKQ